MTPKVPCAHRSVLALCPPLCAQVQVPGGSLALWLFVRVVLPDQSCCCSDRQWESGQPRSSSGGVWVSFIFFFFWGLFWGLFWGGVDRRAGDGGAGAERTQNCFSGGSGTFSLLWEVMCHVIFIS